MRQTRWDGYQVAPQASKSMRFGPLHCPLANSPFLVVARCDGKSLDHKFNGDEEHVGLRIDSMANANEGVAVLQSVAFGVVLLRPNGLGNSERRNVDFGCSRATAWHGVSCEA